MKNYFLLVLLAAFQLVIGQKTEKYTLSGTIKDDFAKKEGYKITFTPIFIEAIAKALRDFPMVNISIDGDKIIKKKNI